MENYQPLRKRLVRLTFLSGQVSDIDFHFTLSKPNEVDMSKRNNLDLNFVYQTEPTAFRPSGLLWHKQPQI